MSLERNIERERSSCGLRGFAASTAIFLRERLFGGWAPISDDKAGSAGIQNMAAAQRLHEWTVLNPDARLDGGKGTPVVITACVRNLALHARLGLHASAGVQTRKPNTSKSALYANTLSSCNVECHRFRSRFSRPAQRSSWHRPRMQQPWNRPIDFYRLFDPAAQAAAPTLAHSLLWYGLGSRTLRLPRLSTRIGSECLRAWSQRDIYILSVFGIHALAKLRRRSSLYRGYFVQMQEYCSVFWYNLALRRTILNIPREIIVSLKPKIVRLR